MIKYNICLRDILRTTPGRVLRLHINWWIHVTTVLKKKKKKCLHFFFLFSLLFDCFVLHFFSYFLHTIFHSLLSCTSYILTTRLKQKHWEKKILTKHFYKRTHTHTFIQKSLRVEWLTKGKISSWIVLKYTQATNSNIRETDAHTPCMPTLYIPRYFYSHSHFFQIYFLIHLFIYYSFSFM